MWTTKCYMCESNDIAESSKYFCEHCEQIRRIASLYGIESIRESCDKIYIRASEPIEKRTEVMSKQIQTRAMKEKSKEDKKSAN